MENKELVSNKTASILGLPFDIFDLEVESKEETTTGQASIRNVIPYWPVNGDSEEDINKIKYGSLMMSLTPAIKKILKSEEPDAVKIESIFNLFQVSDIFSDSGLRYLKNIGIEEKASFMQFINLIEKEGKPYDASVILNMKLYRSAGFAIRYIFSYIRTVIIAAK
jgi:DNA-binding XRE family transcriptional regulator